MRDQGFTLFKYTIALPKGSAWDAKRAHQFMEQLLFAFSTLSFRIMATQQAIEWQIIDLMERPSSGIENAIRASYPDAQVSVEPFGTNEWSQEPFARCLIKYQYSTPLFVAPIQYVTDLTGPDPLASLTEAMSDLRDGERIIYTLIIVGFAKDAYAEGMKLIERLVYTGGLLGLAFPVKVERYVPALQKVLLAKLQQRLYQALVFIQINVPDPARFESLLTVDNQMVNFDRADFNGLHWIDDGSGIFAVQGAEIDLQTSAIGQFALLSNATRHDRQMQTLRQAMRLVMEPKELASLWHLPHNKFSAPTIAWSQPQIRIPARLIGQKKGICLGVNRYASREEAVFVHDRSGHVSLIGKSGVGKSTLLHGMIHQDIANGEGVALIDPHGDLARDVLRWSIPQGREHDVVILDLANEVNPPPMNLLSASDRVERSSAAGQIMALLNTLYDDFREAPTVADTLWATLVTVLADPSPTVRDVVRVLTDPRYRNTLLAGVENAAVQEFWERFEEGRGQQEQLIRPITWRLRAFYGNTLLYPVLCHPDRLDMAALIARKKILLISLKTDEARIPSREQHLLGAALMSQLQLAVLGRPAGSTPYYLYIDEVQHFVTTPLETVLSEARKFGLSLTIANQYLRQLTGSTLDALLGNIGALITFQCGLDDAKALAPYMAPGFDADALINLNKYQAAVKVRYKDETQPAFSLHASAPLVNERALPASIQREAYLRKLSISRYTPKNRAEIMDWLNERYTRTNKPSGTDTSIRFYDES